MRMAGPGPNPDTDMTPNHSLNRTARRRRLRAVRSAPVIFVRPRTSAPSRLGTCMKTISARHRWLLFFLGLAVSAWGIGLGAKLFELTVLIPAWAANPPQS